MTKNWRPPPEWFKKIDTLGEDNELLSNREIAEKLGMQLDSIRKTLVRYDIKYEMDLDPTRPTKRYRVKELRKTAKKALTDYYGD